MKRRRTGYRDPTAERARVGRVEALLAELPRERLVVLLATAVYGLTDRETSERFGIPLDQVEGIKGQTMSRVRHPSRLVSMDALAELDGVVPTSTEFRSMLQRLGLAQLDAPRVCAHCQRPAILPQVSRPAGGRPRKFCSSACRQAAYRARSKLAHKKRATEQAEISR